MISVDEARARILAMLEPPEPVLAATPGTSELVLAAEVHSPIDLPPFSNAAMDGFAVRAEETGRASDNAPVVFVVMRRMLAGDPDEPTWGPGRAVRIMTGARIPPGFDAVIPFEQVEETEPRRIAVRRAVSPNQNVRAQGEDVRTGERLAGVGDQLTPGRIGLLAAAGVGYVMVWPTPRVAVLSTGDELARDRDRRRGPAEIHDANGPMLAALVRRTGGAVMTRRKIGDDPAKLQDVLNRLSDVDLIVSSGGISAGDSDYLRNLHTGPIQLERVDVAMKPGKPLAFGRAGDTPWIALPGNPVAAAVGFWQFVFPALRTLAGHRDLDLPVIPVRISEAIENRGGRRSFVRAVVTFTNNGALATPVGKSGSGMLSSLAAANALIIVPDTTEYAASGEILSAQMID